MIVRKPYFALAVAVLGTEIAIAALLNDAIVRPLVGDALAVALVYLALRAVLPLSLPAAVVAALLTATVIEFGQYLGILGFLHLENNRLAQVVLGTRFDPRDFLAYLAGALAVLLGERLARRRAPSRQ